jgi:hypothetical protein
MQFQTVWQFGSNNPDNANHLATIQQWWVNLKGQEIRWQQRLLTPNGVASELNWEPQRFDETFVMTQPELRGITLYWHKFGDSQERNTTAAKLELDRIHQQLYVYPQSQSDVVIRVELPRPTVQTLRLDSPQWQFHRASNGAHVLIVQDLSQHLEIQIKLNAENLAQLQQQLAIAPNA